ncbi:MAG: helix-turn-helix transcriptional regulator [Bacilli bacterium]|nr:helix-turn-helix transcriptional regulator [Bacilli bacterium]
MSFSDLLNNYIEIFDCTAKELADAANMSPSVISRYRTGDRVPKYDSNQFNQLVDGLATLALKYGINNIDKNKIENELGSTITLNQDKINVNLFRNNFKVLIDALDINISEMARYLGFDPSYLSKIKSGIRVPLNIGDFVDGTVKYVVVHYNDDVSLNKLTIIMGCKMEEFDDENDFCIMLKKWLCNNVVNDSVDNFLQKLDAFDLGDYIKCIKFDKIKVPTLPTGLPKSKVYYGLSGFKASQLDALKSIIFSKAKDDIFFYSNMPMIEASKDEEFTKKFMVGLAFIFKKGLKLNMIHNLNRPFKELMLGLEGWIPLYMTGLINSYYLDDNSDALYSHIECTSGSVALSGSCPTGHIDKARILVTNKKSDVNYYRNNNKLLLEKANKLINIYTIEKKEDYLKIINSNSSISGNRNNILTNLPIYSIDDVLLKDIFSYNNINSSEQKIIINKIYEEKRRINSILNNNKIVDTITIFSKNNFDEKEYYLDLSKVYFGKKIKYNYDLYLRHLNLTKQFRHSNYKLIINKKNIFNNINIYIIKDKQVIITKTNEPVIHFIIYYPTLINAISNFDLIND